VPFPDDDWFLRDSDSKGDTEGSGMTGRTPAPLMTGMTHHIDEAENDLNRNENSMRRSNAAVSHHFAKKRKV
jgi:hypothetical protein